MEEKFSAMGFGNGFYATVPLRLMLLRCGLFLVLDTVVQELNYYH